MAKVQIKSEKITPFGGIFHVRELFSSFVGPVIDKVLGLRCTSYGYQYSEIVGSLASVYFCGGYKKHKAPAMLDGVRGRCDSYIITSAVAKESSNRAPRQQNKSA